MNFKIGAIIQARTGSTRFPNKVFATLSNRPLIWHVFNRIKYSKLLSSFILATTQSVNDDSLVTWALQNEISFFRGSENDVLSRYYFAAKEFKLDIVVRITADDPFKDPDIVDLAIKTLIENNLNFVSNNNPATFPEGYDIEVFDIKSLEYAFYNSTDPFEREHVTQFFHKNPNLFKMKNIVNSEDFSNLRWTIDTENDYNMAKNIYENLYCEGKIFMYPDVMNYLSKHPEVILINSAEKRSAMYINNLNNQYE